MGADRFYCPDLAVGRPAYLADDEARHLARVRRVAVGAEVELFDGRGLAAVAVVVHVGRDRVELRPERRLPGVGVAAVEFTLGTAIPKGDRFDWLIEKATELGVARVVPLITARSTVDPRAAKLDRLRRAVIEACKQSRRDRLMTLDEPITWERWVVQIDAATPHRWVAHPGGGAIGAQAVPGVGERVAVAIGPEGGLTDQEVELAWAAGWTAVALTPTILRVETAGLAVASRVLLGLAPVEPAGSA